MISFCRPLNPFPVFAFNSSFSQKINLERGELRQKNKDALKRKEELNDMLGAKQMEIAKIRGETEKLINDFNARLVVGVGSWTHGFVGIG